MITCNQCGKEKEGVPTGLCSHCGKFGKSEQQLAFDWWHNLPMRDDDKNVVTKQTMCLKYYGHNNIAVITSIERSPHDVLRLYTEEMGMYQERTKAQDFAISIQYELAEFDEEGEFTGININKLAERLLEFTDLYK